MLQPTLALLPGVLVVLVAESHGLATQHGAQQIINNELGVAQLALSLVINQMSLLKILNESSTCSLQERQLQKMVELEVKTGELKNELQDTKMTAINELENIKTAIQDEAAQGLQDLKEAALRELQTMKTTILNELQQATRRKIYKKYDLPTTQPQALEACERLGGRLALPTNKEEDEQISWEIGVSFSEDIWWTVTYWISGTDQQQEGVWIDSVTGERLIYKNFKPGEPSNTNRKEHCLDMGPSFSGWNDRPCEHRGTGYVCEFTN